MKQITSKDNPKIKEVLKLAKTNHRRKSGLFVIEGTREIELASRQGVKLETIFVCPELLPDFQRWTADNEDLYELPAGLFAHLAYKEKPEGIIAIAKSKTLSLSDIKLSPSPLILVLEQVEKPGNLGAILRTAFAAGIDAIIINSPQTDIHNPNVIRSSMGHIFSVPIAIASIAATVAWLKDNAITSYATAITASHDYSQQDYRSGTAFIMGTENSGLSPEWLAAADRQIIIPMKTGIDSLNVSVSAAIISYEALRQRQFPNRH